MESLLAFKTGNSYIREKDGEFTLCSMDKASVFPESGFPFLLDKYHLLKKIYGDLQIVRLVVTEEPFYKE